METFIFTAAHNPAGKSALIFELARKGYWDLITSQYAWEEARRNISIKFPGCLPEMDKLPGEIRIFLHSIQAFCPLELPDQDTLTFIRLLTIARGILSLTNGNLGKSPVVIFRLQNPLTPSEEGFESEMTGMKSYNNCT